MPTSCGARFATLAPFPSSPAGAAASDICYDKERCRGRHLIENAFLPPQGLPPRPRPLRQLAANFLPDVALAIAIAFGL